MFRLSFRLVWAIALGMVTFSGCPASQGPDIGRLPTITSHDPQAESEMARARQLDEQGKRDEAAAAYRRFLDDRPSDPLVPVAQLALGRILLHTGDNAEASRLFERVSRHPDPAVAEQGRFYGAVADHRLGAHTKAISVLEPMVGRTIDPADTALLLHALAGSLVEAGDYERALRALDNLATEALPETDRQWAREQVTELVESKATPEAIERLYRELPKDGLAWPYVVKRAVRDADAAGDSERARKLLEVMREQGLPIEGNFEAIAIRAERPAEADPRVVGAVLSLSGRARKVGEQALRGLMYGAGLPPQGPLPADAPKLVFRDDGGDPARAVEAVNELVTVHRAIAVIGPLDASAAEAAAARAQELGVPLIALTPAGHITDKGPMAFRLFVTPRAEVQRLLAHAKSLGKRRVGGFLPEGPYGDLMRDTVAAEARLLGLEVIPFVRYPADATSFGTQVAELAKSKFDALVLADSARRAALIAPALAAAGLWSTPEGAEPPSGGRAITVLAASVAFDRNLARQSGRYLQGGVFSVPFDPETASGTGRSFADGFQKQYGASPDSFAAFAYDAYRIVRRAVDGGATTRPALAQALTLPTSSEELATPASGFTPDREPRSATRLLRLEGEVFVPVSNP